MAIDPKDWLAAKTLQGVAANVPAEIPADKIEHKIRYENSCDHCRFFFPIPPGIDGKCRRNAPSPVEAPDHEKTPVFRVHWPLVTVFDWCGEFEEKRQTEP